MNYKKAMTMFSLSAAIAAYVVFAMTFVSAYFDPTRTVVVNINSFGEANLEFLLIALGSPVVLYWLFRMFDISDRAMKRPIKANY
ncbi:MAG: hypothetical protein NT120_02675 [Candidatus Aenigmarchaeota archaeon]|nr:hypothetical protein [Candidatus Aenigmarchaeota archaeon]